VKLTLIFAEAGVDLVPPELWKHPSVKKWASKRGKSPKKCLLDISFHYSAMKELKDWWKRGRPDILHLCLLEALDSPLNRKGMLQVYAHTYAGKIMKFRQDVRIPKNYFRFIGLMEQLLTEGKVPPDSEDPLIKIEDTTLRAITSKCSHIYLMDEMGVKKSALSFAEEIVKHENPCIIIGCFQSGTFSPDIYMLADERVKIFDEALASWTVTSRVLTAIEIKLGLL